MKHRRPLKPLLALATCSCIAISASAQEARRFGETVVLGPDLSLTVTKRDVGEFRSRYPGEFPSTVQNLVAFELRSKGTGKATYVFWTDRTDPSRSDVVALCGATRVNILKVGGGTFSNPKTHQFGSPGGFEIKGRWGSVVASGAPPSVLFFSLPPSCVAGQVRLSMRLDVDDGKEREHKLIFSQR